MSNNNVHYHRKQKLTKSLYFQLLQNWYSQNKPARLNGVGDGYAVGGAARVGVGMAAIVAATACWIWALGSVVVLGLQATVRNRSRQPVKRRGVFLFIQMIINEVIVVGTSQQSKIESHNKSAPSISERG
jgi:hypothetical protein